MSFIEGFLLGFSIFAIPGILIFTVETIDYLHWKHWFFGGQSGWWKK